MRLSTDVVPLLDLTPYRSGEPGALESLGGEMRRALEDVGFFSIVGHGVDWGLVEDIYHQAARYHALPDEAKRAQAMTPRRMGYNPLGGESIEGRMPSLNAAFFLARPASTRNQWPEEAMLPGFRAACSAYYGAMDRFCHDWLLPLANPVDGLWIRPGGGDPPGGGDWCEVRPEPRSFVVNSGDMLRRWSNDR